MIFSRLAVIAQDPDFFLERSVVGRDRAGLTKRAQIFARIKTEATGVAD